MDLLRGYGSAGKQSTQSVVRKETPKSTAATAVVEKRESDLQLPEPKAARRKLNEEEEVDKQREEKKSEHEEEEEEEEEEDDDDLGGAVSALPKLKKHTAQSAGAAAVGPSVSSHAQAAAPSVSLPGPAMPPRNAGFVAWYPEVGDTSNASAAARNHAAYPSATNAYPEAATGIVEINQASLLHDQAIIQKHLQHEIKNPPATLTTTFGGRRKHQLSSMASESVQNMELYEAQRREGLRTKKTVGAKYGWK
jgi:hypothetical protein